MATIDEHTPREECRCPCHRLQAVVLHPVECCRRCPHCHRRITTAAFSEHRARCAREHALRVVRRAEDRRSR